MERKFEKFDKREEKFAVEHLVSVNNVEETEYEKDYMLIRK